MSRSTTTSPDAPFAPTVLSPDQRAALAADPGFGGGNLLRRAIAANPRPDLPFLRTDVPLADADGAPCHELSLRQLDELAQSWSAWYRDRGVRPRDRVAVQLDDSLAYTVHFHALAQIGAIGVLINSRAPAEIALSLIRQTAPVGLYVERTRLARIETALEAGLDALPGLPWVQVADDLPVPARRPLPDHARFPHVDDDPVVILHSSGTTGIPKPTVHTHRSIVFGPRFRLTDHREVPGAVTMTALPQSHLGCIAYTVYAVLAGAPTIAASDRPGPELAAAIARHRPTAVMSFAHAYSELAATRTASGALDSVDVWVSIGDAVHEAHIKDILGRRGDGRPPAAFLDRLGTTELGWGVLVKVRTLHTPRHDRCAGRPVGVAEVAVLRPDGTQAALREVGLLAARGPAVTPEYWNNSDLTHRSRLAGYWLTGDNAYRDEHGDHFLVDRSVDTIDTPEGRGYSVFMEETLLCDVPPIVDCAVVAGRDEDRVVPVAVVALVDGDGPAPTAQDLLAAANEALRRSGQPPLGVLEIVGSSADIPLGVTGKVLKRRLRQRYAALSGYLAERAGRAVAAVDAA